MVKRTILITGGGGFIGSHLCDRFLADNFKVICIDNFITGRRENLKHALKNKNFRLIVQDVNADINITGKVDYVLHCASLASPQDYLRQPIETLKSGSYGTFNTLGLAKEQQAVFMLFSTSEVYGDPLVHPQKENNWGHVNPIGLRSCYDESKRFAEALTMAYHRAYKLDTRIVRIFNTYGPRMRKDDGRAVPNFLDQALKNKPLTIYGSGRQTRSFCHINDLVEGVAKLLFKTYHLPVNLGNPNEFSIKYLSKLILKLTGSKSKIKFLALPQDDPHRRQPDITLARRLIKWQPVVSLEDGLKSTILWLKG